MIGLGALSVGCGFVPDGGEGDTDPGGSTGGSDESAADDSASASSVGSTGGADTSDDEDPDGGSSGEDESTTGEPPEPYDTEIEWAPCPLYTGGTGQGASCADVPLPIDWSDPQGETLTVFVKRIGNPEASKQLWMLMGGPGAAGAGYESNAEAFTDADEDLVVYLPDHRGVGRSTHLGCPDQEAPGSDEGMTITMDEWPGCIDYLEQTWGESLDHFSTTAASHDLGWLVEKLRGDQAVHVFGGSYGTYWAHRHTQVNPGQADSVSLLGIASPEFNFTRFTVDYDAAGRRFMDRCSEDPFCAARLGPDAQATMEQIMGEVDEGLCPGALAAGLDRQTLKVYFSAQLSWSWSNRAIIPAVLYRLQRCNAADVAALAHAAPLMEDPLAGLTQNPLFSRVINVHVSLSEMWHPPFQTVEQAQADADAALFGLGSTVGRVTLHDQWPTYAHDEYVQQYAETDTPMLMMVGEFDPNSPVAEGEQFAEHFEGEHQHYLEIPDGTHGWDSPTTQGYGCAINVFFNFIQDPEQPLLDCMDDVVPMNFAGTPSMAQWVFGTDDLYEN